jgi:NADPH:quinone reductase-like Zn-dependent oxidoreductase
MKVWEVQDDWGTANMRLVERPDPGAPGPGMILIRMHAASVNYRDYATVLNRAPFGKLPQIPFSDGAGEVVAVGEGVTRFAVGDRVCPNFFPDWIEGPPSAANRAVSLGSASAPGILQKLYLTHAEAASRVPDHLSWIEAATLPCAGLTAWRSLVAEGGLKASDTVLVQGTGGVSIFALQFAKMHGATVIATSSSDEKLERVRALGADHTINYRNTPEWGKAALEITGGRGVDHVVEVGGAGTINQSLTAAAVGANILIIGVLGGRSQELLMPAIFGKNLRLLGISVGSRSHFEQMTAGIGRAGMHPVVDRVFPFAEAPAAIDQLQVNAHFGKICIDFDS